MSALPDTEAGCRSSRYAAFLEALHNEVLNRKLPDPPESVVHYRAPPGTFDGAMAREVRPAMPDNMPNFAPKPKDAPGTPGTYAPVLGGRGMPVMMDSSPPDQGEGGATPLIKYPNGRTSEDSQTTPGSALATYGTETPGTWGTGDLPTRAPQGGTDIVSLLRGMFQGAL
jgi:hypothetical protein